MKPQKSLMGISRFSMAGFLIALIILFVAAPFAAQLENGRLYESALLTVVLICAVLAVGHRRGVFWTAILMVTPAVIAKWINHFWPDSISPVVSWPPS